MAKYTYLPTYLAGNKYVWLKKIELSWQPTEDMLMSEPKLVNNCAQFTFQSDSLES